MCKSAAFLKPPSKLNPTAKEWRPPHLHRLIHPLHQPPSLPPPPPPPGFGGHHPQQLLWLPHQLVNCPIAYTSYIPRPCTAGAAFYHSPSPLPFPAPGPPCAAAPPPFAVEKKVLEHYVEKPAKVASKVWRREWVQKKTEAECAAAAPPSPAAVFRRRTTVMVRNIPNQLRRDYLVEFVDSYCKEHSLKYDFMYLPMDFRSKDNLGYAFLNFPRDGDAYKFKRILQNYKWGTVETSKGLYTSKKICAISWATFQGKEKLVKRFEDTVFDCDDLEFLPVVFDPPRGGSDISSPVVVGRVKREVS